ncbi:hypothetical protein F5Y18DRAFT_210957 [Xylariaceae sp. FL1019]|nr:hypothetical protein F5Y18DRAFT_210957 [Xylariaceae sp. FL1019]
MKHLTTFAAALSVCAATSLMQLHAVHDVRTQASRIGKVARVPTDTVGTQECSSKEMRVEWGNMTNADRVSFVNSIKCLMEAPPKIITNLTSRYDELVNVHNSMSTQIHQYGVFLAWHRYFVNGFKSLLRDECDYQAPYPWWYEIRDNGNFSGSSIFTPEYFGSLQVSHQPEDHEPDSYCVTDGAFANRTVTVGVFEPECLSRGEDQRISNLTTLKVLNSCQSNITKFSDHEECVSNGIHVSTHAAVGKIMGNVPASVNDPVFFMHHGFIDWEWMRWQRVVESRYSDISGCYYVDFDEDCVSVTLDTVLSSGGIFPNMTIREVINPTTGPLCYEYDFY